MTKFRNIGNNPWKRSSGEEVPRGGTFTPTQRELRRFQRRQWMRTFLEEVSEEEVVAVADVATTAVASNKSDDVAEVDTVTQDQEQPQEEKLEETPVETWPLTMQPAQYIKLHPRGQHAKLARRILKAEKRE